MSIQADREWIEARRRILVGSILAPSDKDQFIEASFATHFGRNVPEPGFWAAFEQACSFAADGIPWHQPRQLMLSYSLPQQVNGKDARGETMMTLAATFGRAKVVFCVKSKATHASRTLRVGLQCMQQPLTTMSTS
ncbi:hypothetical protein PF008_g9545 [Phytophthora fragariae]|uniref:Uncharacterized protein n=1 Tax=Phytophthora fragariae TaxID=53985 RepID=A0A6G0RWE0_9STRA|nr:hypothetical protein PF008_g9545 [Phytophthora fragariae]